MKVVKLDSRHRAFKHGYTHACRFGRGEPGNKYWKIIDYLSEKYPKTIISDNSLPFPWSRQSFAKFVDEWETVIGTGAWNNRIMWICVKHEETLTMAFLSIDFA